MFFLVLACTTTEVNDPNPAPVPPTDPVPESPLTTWDAKGTLTAVSVKNGTAEVPGTLDVGGQLTFADTTDLEGISGTLTADLNTWNSQLELRDDRVKQTFFQVADHATATFEAKGLNVAGGKGTLDGELSLHGTSKDVSVPVEILHTEAGMALRSTEPWVVKISDHDMGTQLDALITLCAHDSIADEVKVTVDVQLGEAPAWPAAE